MIISRTPLRISFVGGGSDMPSFYTRRQGAVVSTAIDKYVYIMVSKQFDGRIIIQYSKVETVKKVGDIENNLVREAMKLVGVENGVHITSISDVPSEGTGMGTSSSYVVGLLNALYAYKGKHIYAERLARDACKIEIDILKKPIGKQDQYIAAYGGFQYIQFNKDNTVYVNPIICSSRKKNELKNRLLLFYTGLTRSSDSILARQNNNIITQVAKQQEVEKMVALAKSMRVSLNNNTINPFGHMLDQNWKIKRAVAEGITTKKIDQWYRKALQAGAEGGKILGAGGGGFMLLYAKQKYHKDIKRALSDLIPLNFEFEPQGSRIIFVED